MTTEVKKLPFLHCICELCSHEWKTFAMEPPRMCPKCHSRSWNGVKPVGRPRKVKA